MYTLEAFEVTQRGISRLSTCGCALYGGPCSALRKRGCDTLLVKLLMKRLAIPLMELLAIPLGNQNSVAKWLVISN